MANRLFDSLNSKRPTLQDQLFQLRADPIRYLTQRRLNIPQELQGDPKGIVQYLLNTGQMSGAVYEKLQSQVHSMMG